jgi:hypothetical protein
MRTLFFSNPSEKEYEGFFKKGSRRRRTTDSNENSISSASASASVVDSGSSTCSAQGQNTNEIKVRRATAKPYPEEASIYVIDNFLTEAELEYFDKKIATIPFERSFVDNSECYDDDEDDHDDTCDDDACTGDDEPADNDKEKRVNCDGDGVGNEGKEEKNDTVNIVKEQKVSGVVNNTSSSAISTSPCNNGEAEDVNNEVGTTTHKNDNNDKNKNNKGKKRKKIEKRQPATLVDDSHRTSTFYSFKKLHDSKISALERRIATMLVSCFVTCLFCFVFYIILLRFIHI